MQAASTDVSIRLREIAKMYRLTPNKPFFMWEIFRRLARRPAPGREFWALRDVTFEVKRNEAVAVIGHNGAGKSTLLGIVAETIFPTRGSVEVNGRVCALLELGAGFHPDLTGRENIYLNASLLGLNRQEVEERYQWIVDFSELSAFIDQPMRTYSSGMWVRLGFSIAVFAEPEILIVDEVLAVGDKDFQKKCCDRIMTLKENGTTFLLVSHNAEYIRFLCNRAVWIEHGVVRADGNAEEVVNAYTQSRNP